ncbi:MAG TPA: hypothetical protein VIG72_00425 [Pontibacter sp.]
MKLILRLSVYLFFTTMALLAGCTPDEHETETGTTTSLTKEAQAQQQLISDTRQELKKWFRYYGLKAEQDTLFKLREVWEASLLTLPLQQNWQELYSDYPRLFKPSPDKTGLLDIYTYERTFDRKRNPQVAADSPDSEVAIAYPDKGEKVRLMFCGTPCLFEDAWWRNRDEVIVVGLVQEAGSTGYFPTVWHINLYTSLIRQYTSGQPAQLRKNEPYLTREVLGKL